MSQLTDQVVLRLLLAELKLFVKPCEYALTSSPHAVRFVRKLEDVSHPAGEGVRQVLGHPEDLGDDPYRNLLRVVSGRVGLPVANETFDQPSAELTGHHHVAIDS